MKSYNRQGTAFPWTIMVISSRVLYCYYRYNHKHWEKWGRIRENIK